MAVLAAAAAVGGLALAWFAGQPDHATALGFRLDDAWIHMVYGREVARSGILAYNPGVPGTGATSPLWALCLALVHLVFGWASIDTVVLAVYVLGGLLHVATAVAAAALAASLTGSRLAALFAGVLVGISPPLAAAAFSGMEVCLTAFLLLLALWLLTQDRFFWAGLAFALSSLARPETAVVTVVALVVVALCHREGWVGAVLRLGLMSAVLGGAWIGWNLWATGNPLPATFYAKESTAPLALLPGRLATGFGDILGRVPPLLGGVGWLAAVGLVAWRRSPARALSFAPLVAGLLLAVANLVLVRPTDPEAFYHVRYLLPAAPALVVGLTVGASLAGGWLGARWRAAPVLALLAVGVFGTVVSVGRESAHLHNDTRNINELQRTMGTWLGESLPADAWVASNDAGAVRYFSDRPTVDLMGLNTPRVITEGETWAREHPVAAIALMPAWLRPTDAAGLELARQFITPGYTVTSNEQMAAQVVLTCTGPSEEPRPVHLRGLARVTVYCVPPPSAL